jgi:hypothetical protein
MNGLAGDARRKKMERNDQVDGHTSSSSLSSLSNLFIIINSQKKKLSVIWRTNRINKDYV